MMYFVTHKKAANKILNDLSDSLISIHNPVKHSITQSVCQRIGRIQSRKRPEKNKSICWSAEKDERNQSRSENADLTAQSKTSMKNLQKPCGRRLFCLYIVICRGSYRYIHNYA